jgi:hypothetical protein
MYQPRSETPKGHPQTGECPLQTSVSQGLWRHPLSGYAVDQRATGSFDADLAPLERMRQVPRSRFGLTVDHHVSAVLAKLDAPTRDVAASQAVSHGAAVAVSSLPSRSRPAMAEPIAR